jgi:hypothetical protein
MPRGFYKHKVVLDENMPHRTDLPTLNSKFDVKHVVDDLKHSGLSDPAIYQLAVAQKRILVTFNVKHFRSRAGSKADAGIIGVSANLPPSQIDTKLTALLTKSTPHAIQPTFRTPPQAADFLGFSLRQICRQNCQAVEKSPVVASRCGMSDTGEIYPAHRRDRAITRPTPCHPADSSSHNTYRLANLPFVDRWRSGYRLPVFYRVACLQIRLQIKVSILHFSMGFETHSAVTLLVVLSRST